MFCWSGCGCDLVRVTEYYLAPTSVAVFDRHIASRHFVVDCSMREPNIRDINYLLNSSVRNEASFKVFCCVLDSLNDFVRAVRRDAIL